MSKINRCLLNNNEAVNNQFLADNFLNIYPLI